MYDFDFIDLQNKITHAKIEREQEIIINLEEAEHFVYLRARCEALEHEVEALKDELDAL